MGKVVRSARFVDEKYIVAIPRIESSCEPEQVSEPDVRFASPFGLSEDRPLDEERAPLAPAEPSIDWAALQVQADALIERAAADARAMLEEAAALALETVADAQARVAAIEAGARTRGSEEGQLAGRAAIEAELTPMVESLRELIESARLARRGFIEGAEPELVKLATAIAERVVGHQTAIDPTIVVESVRAALTRLVSREVVTLRLNPADLDAIRIHRDALIASNDVEHLRIIEDSRVDRGGVVLETDAGTIDGKIATQLREARKSMQSDESIALAPSGEEGVLHSAARAS